MKSFDRILLRWDGSFAIVSEIASANRAGGVELWKPILVKKQKKPDYQSISAMHRLVRR